MSSPKSTLLRMLAAMASVLSFGVGFAVVCAAIGRQLPLGEIPIVEPKLDYLARQGDQFDTLFIGSSRIHYQIVPSLFDELLREAGHPLRSFNAGIAGMNPPEDSFVLDYILAHRTKKLRWVFIELASIRTPINANAIGTFRTVYWHDLSRLLVLGRRAFYLYPKKRSWRETFRQLQKPLGEFSDHLAPFFRNVTHQGRGEILTRHFSDIQPGAISQQPLGDKLDGWTEADRPQQMSEPELAAYELDLAARRQVPAQKEARDPISQDALARMLSSIRRAGATPVLLVPPTTGKRNFYPAAGREKLQAIFDFSDPEVYPELFDPNHRLDSDHLNAVGARLFTRALAQRWIAELEREQP